MKKLMGLTIILSCLLFSACNSSVGVIGGADGPTAIYVTDREPVKMVNIDGSLYYEIGEDNDIVGRCGTMDGEFNKAVDRYEIPKNSGEANFQARGYQYGTIDNTVEIPIGDDCEIFKKIEDNEDILKYNYCYIVEGKIPNKMNDGEILVLADTKEVTFEEAYNKLTGEDGDIFVLPIMD